MKTCVAVFGLALVAPVYGGAHPQHWSGGHHRFHNPSRYGLTASGSVVSSAPTGTVPAVVVGGGIWNSSAVLATAPGFDLGLLDECYRPNGVPMGWLPDGVDIMTIQNKVDPTYPPCTYGNYAQITSATSMTGPNAQMDSQSTNSSTQGAIYTIALQPLIPFSEISASAVATSMNEILADGPEIIWLRLAHEMNWYIDTNTINTDPSVRYHGTTAEFKAMWQAVATAVDRSRVKMFWSAVPPFAPGDTVETLNTEWFPGSEYVDIVGLDAYGEILSGEQATFETMMGAFCALYPDIPVALAETGWLNGGTMEEKEYWLGQVSAKETLDVCPQYIGFSWFEYDKDGDYRIVMGDDGNIAKTILADVAVSS
ncbi:MAG: hypothetical protein ASARMPRED_002301 [Alectoria sarmentosa]|nr:MAG: hypothetical protein ASARMPRED_002301 [Alectoria sarmentosa]